MIAAPSSVQAADPAGVVEQKQPLAEERPPR
jgi:hypothetical protein